jgi:ketosteroid isomerase-like protein
VVDNRRVVERYAEAVHTRDLEALEGLMHPEIMVRYPQSGEVIRGRDHYCAMLANYPWSLPDADLATLRGAPETVHVASPLPFGMPTITVVGSDDTFVLEGTARYPNGSVFLTVWIIGMRDGKIAEETAYYAAPFEAPEWRHPYVEA